MANGNFPACNGVTRKWEGGDVNHPLDPGGLTSRGVTAAAGAAHRKRLGLPAKAVTKWTEAEVERFYRVEYWDRVNAELLPWGVDLATYDPAVNSGVSRGAKWLQSAVGVTQDGKVGPETIRAIVNPKTTIQRVCAKRLGFVQGLRTWSTFGKGWARRIADIEARAVAMWLAHAGRQSVPADMEVEASKASKTAADQSNGAAGTVATGGAGGAADVAANGSVNWWLIGALVLAVLLTAGVLAWKARNNKLRAAAYREVGLEAAVGGAVK